MAKSRAVAQSRALGVDAVPLGRLLGQVDRQTARLVETTALAGRGLSIDQWRALDILSDGDGHPMSELISAIVVPGATLTKIMDKLVDAALVYRLVDDRDRRRVLAFLSDKGREIHAELAPRVAEAEAEAIESLGQDGSVFVELLAHLVWGPSGERPRD